MVTDDSLGPVGERRQRNVSATGVLQPPSTMPSVVPPSEHRKMHRSSLASDCQVVSVWLPLHTVRTDTGYSTLDTVRWTHYARYCTLDTVRWIL